MKPSRKLDVGLILLLWLLPLLWFGPQALGSKTLLPADNLYAYQPWAGQAAEMGATPHNPLISDLILENYPWKSFVRQALEAGQVPLWSPRLFAGAPFLAAGQHSALYPLSLIFYLIPLWRAYGVFTWLQVGLAAAATYVFARVLRQRPIAAAVAGIAFAFSGFYITSVNFTMIIAAAAWLPLILAMIELVIRTSEGVRVEVDASSPELGWGPRRSAVPYAVLGAIFLGVQVLAGHIEITYYVLMVSAFYAAWRLAGAWLRLRLRGVSRRARLAALARPAGWLAVMIGAGLALGGVQLVPLYELVSQSFRQGSASLQQVVDWAWPKKQILTFLLPDAFGNPTHHSYFDIWRRSWMPVTTNALGEPLRDITGGAVDWGIKNYVEGANYLGIGTLLLAAMAVLALLGTLWRDLRQRAGVIITLLGPEAGPLDRHPEQVDLPGSEIPGNEERGTASDSEPSSRVEGEAQPMTGRWPALGFAVLAVLSLLFAFGSPLYAVLFYLVPGYNQLHSAFRWVYPYTLSMALLAGWALSWVLEARERANNSAILHIARFVGALALAAGLLALALVGLSVFVPGQFVALGDRLLASSDLARTRGFAGGAMAWSYEAVGLARLGAMAALSGLALYLLGRPSVGLRLSRSRPALRSWPALILACVIVLDLWLMGHDFNPASDPALLAYTPPIIEWLRGRQDGQQPWRLTTLDAPGEKLLNANSLMAYGLEDVRGYDSIIPRQYVAYMDRIQTQGELPYNRIAPLYAMGDGQGSPSLDSRLLDLLGVRYVATAQAIPNANYTLVYPLDHAPADKEMRVYENTEAFPRVFIAAAAVAAPNQTAALDALQDVDPAQTVVVEGIASDALPPTASPQVREARISDNGLRQVLVDVNISDRGWLVFTDNFFPGWKAYLREFGAQGEGVDASGESVEQQIPIYRADGTFRAVYLDRAGQWTVRFVYSPQSFLQGVYLSFLAAMVLLLAFGAWAWGRYYRAGHSDIGTAAKNSAVQVTMSLLNRAIDFAFAMLRLRMLGPLGEGSYVNAINFYLVFEILTRFGLGTLLTRDVARDRSQAWRYLNNVIVLRVLLWLVALPLVFGTGLAYHLAGQMTPEEAQTIAIFCGALLFANIADAITSVFNAFEEMEYPAGITTAITVGKVGLGALVLLPPLNTGFVGLAGVSLLMNVVQTVWLYVLLRRRLVPPEEIEGKLDWGLQRAMIHEAGPLMINHLLATIFWRISQFGLRWMAGAAALGIFSVGVKFLDGLNVIPAYFTLAIFPLMSRYAQSGTDALLKAYRLALQVLLIVALPIAVLFTFAATPLVRVVGGTAFLPDSATALAIMIWSITIGFMNSVTQYVLIAVGQQRQLTRAFAFGVTFTAIANLLLVPRYGYQAAAAILILAELSLFIPFAWVVNRYVAPMPWLRLIGTPLVGALANCFVCFILLRARAPLVLALLAGFLTYVVVLLAMGTFRGDDYTVLRAKLPQFHVRVWRRA